MTSLLFALAAAAANLLGGLALVGRVRTSLRLFEVCIAFGAGFMLAVALLGVLPVVFTGPGSSIAGFYVLGGYLAVHLAQHVLAPHFHFGEETHHVSVRTGFSALLGLSLHTFFDGVAIAAGFRVSPQLGLLLFIAVFLHKLPEGVTAASLMLAGGQSRGRALGAVLVLGAATMLGVVLTDTLAPLARWGLAISAGVTLYVAASELVPHIQGKRGWVTPVALLGGAIGFSVTELLLRAGGLP